MEEEERAKQIGTTLLAPLQAALNAADNVAKAFQSLQAAGVTDRETYNDVLREVLERNPEFIGTWSAWEPDALDGRDAQFVNSPGHDSTGRYIPYWNRGGGEVVLEPLVDYETPGAGDYYIKPRDTGRKMVMEPFFYNVAGKDVFLTTMAVPIVVEGKVVGVSGVDISLETIQQKLTALDLDTNEKAFVVSNGGTIAAHTDGSKTGETLAALGYDQAIMTRVAQGETVTAEDPAAPGQNEAVFAPIEIAGTDTPWTVAVVGPTS